MIDKFMGAIYNNMSKRIFSDYFEVPFWRLKYGKANMSQTRIIIPSERIENLILLIRGQKVMLDSDLANLYGVETKALIRAMKRNMERFPSDFMFQLSTEEFNNLRTHFGISSQWGGRRYPPYAFTEQGVAMLSGVLKSKRAVKVNVEIMRTFVKLRLILNSQENLARKLATLEKKYDKQFKIVFDAIRQLMDPKISRKKQIGFEKEEKR